MPAPPGTHSTSSAGQSAKVVVGISTSPVAVVTGPLDWATRWTRASGKEANTS